MSVQINNSTLEPSNFKITIENSMNSNNFNHQYNENQNNTRNFIKKIEEKEINDKNLQKNEKKKIEKIKLVEEKDYFDSSEQINTFLDEKLKKNNLQVHKRFKKITSNENLNVNCTLETELSKRSEDSDKSLEKQLKFSNTELNSNYKSSNNFNASSNKFLTNISSSANLDSFFWVNNRIDDKCNNISHNFNNFPSSVLDVSSSTNSETKSCTTGSILYSDVESSSISIANESKHNLFISNEQNTNSNKIIFKENKNSSNDTTKIDIGKNIINEFSASFNLANNKLKLNKKDPIAEYDLDLAESIEFELGLKKQNGPKKNSWGNLSYAELITRAIESSLEQRLTLSQIYDWIVRYVPYFKEKYDRTTSAGWKNSIRHNLSLHNRFIRVQNESSGKSSWWMINPDINKYTISSSTSNSDEFKTPTSRIIDRSFLNSNLTELNSIDEKYNNYTISDKNKNHFNRELNKTIVNDLFEPCEYKLKTEEQNNLFTKSTIKNIGCNHNTTLIDLSIDNQNNSSNIIDLNEKKTKNQLNSHFESNISNNILNQNNNKITSNSQSLAKISKLRSKSNKMSNKLKKVSNIKNENKRILNDTSGITSIYNPLYSTCDDSINKINFISTNNKNFNRLNKNISECFDKSNQINSADNKASTKMINLNNFQQSSNAASIQYSNSSSQLIQNTLIDSPPISITSTSSTVTPPPTSNYFQSNFNQLSGSSVILKTTIQKNTNGLSPPTPSCTPNHINNQTDTPLSHVNKQINKLLDNSNVNNNINNNRNNSSSSLFFCSLNYPSHNEYSHQLQPSTDAQHSIQGTISSNSLFDYSSINNAQNSGVIIQQNQYFQNINQYNHCESFFPQQLSLSNSPSSSTSSSSSLSSSTTFLHHNTNKNVPHFSTSLANESTRNFQSNLKPTHLFHGSSIAQQQNPEPYQLEILHNQPSSQLTGNSQPYSNYNMTNNSGIYSYANNKSELISNPSNYTLNQSLSYFDSNVQNQQIYSNSCENNNNNNNNNSNINNNNNNNSNINNNNNNNNNNSPISVSHSFTVGGTANPHSNSYINQYNFQSV